MSVRRAAPGENDPGPAALHRRDCGCSATTTDPYCTAERELRALDEEIARLRGWTLDSGGWRPPWHAKQWEHNYWLIFGPVGEPDVPLPFSTSWALAGPLLEEMAARTDGGFSHGVVATNCYGDAGPIEWAAGPGAWSVAEAGDCECEHGAAPCEAIARAWVAWRKARP